MDAIKKEILEGIPEDDEDERKLAYRAFERLREKYFREDILTRRRRPDARAFDEIRKITCEIGLLPRVHGSAPVSYTHLGFEDAKGRDAQSQFSEV